MKKLDVNDLSWAVKRLPRHLKEIMKSEKWMGQVFLGGGYIRALIAKEPINDIDLFVKSTREAELLAHEIEPDPKMIHKTDNAYTIRGKMPIQIIYRWVFEKPEDVANSFDFTICCAVIFCQKDEEKGFVWESFCDSRYYQDLAAKRLVYRSPVRNEDAGGSMLRVLKYYQRGYRIPLDSLGAIVARLMSGVDETSIMEAAGANSVSREEQVAKVVTGLLREVDPNIDPKHEAHLPSMKNEGTDE